MKLKLDENLGSRHAEPLRTAGFDVTSVAQQGLTGAADRELIDLCHAEKRCLVTLDLEFGNPLIFDPAAYSGIAMIRLSGPSTAAALLACMETLAFALKDSPIVGRLWVIQPGRVREHQQE